ncbi:MAG: hypothetical protein PVJ05_02090, partial [Candidatus Thorarchaeota archaeon]
WPLDWIHVPPWNITEGDVLSTGEYLYFTGIPDVPDWNGPAYVHTLSQPFSLDKLSNFSVQLEVDNSQNGYNGKIHVFLMDSNLFPVVLAYVGDAWTGSSQGHIFAEYFTPDIDQYQHGMTTVSTFTGFDGTMMFSYNESGVHASVTGYGEALLYSPNATEVQREIAHVLILTGKKFSTYMPSRIYDINLEWKSDSVYKWHHDCSNLTAFTPQSDNSWALYSNTEGQMNVVPGSLMSSGSYIYPTDMGSGSMVHGPLYSYELSSLIPLEEFREFKASIEVSTSSINQLGGIYVALNDQENTPIVGLLVWDAWSDANATIPEGFWMFSNRSIIRLGYGRPHRIDGGYNETLRVWKNVTGLYTDLPLNGIYKFMDSEELNTTRTISYVSIHGIKYETDPMSSIVRLHDIRLEWGDIPPSEPPPTTTPTTPPDTTTQPTTSPSETTPTSSSTTSTNPGSTNGTWNWGDLPDPIIFLITGMAGTILVLVIVVVCIGRQRGP